jgi:rRNA-processing protein EBP2
MHLQVKRQLLEQAAKVEASEMRRKQRDAKKYGKALQTERRLEKEKRKADDLQEITKWRKNKPAGEADREKDEELFSMAASKIPKKKGLHDFVAERTGKRDEPQKSAKRLAADKKYGRGGIARTLAKRNTFESAHDMSDFSARKNKNHGVSFKKGECAGLEAVGCPCARG